MFRQFRSAVIAMIISIAAAGTASSAIRAPQLPASIAAGANDLQRAAWACEAGAPILAAGSTTAKTGRIRYFLSGAGEAGTNEAPLVLGGARLAGLGWLSDDKGWSVIRFSCALTPDLRRATSFGFSVVAEAAAANGDPTASDSTAAPPASARTWQVRPSMAMLAHSVEETDDRDFRADCVPHSGKVSILLSQTVPWLKSNGFVVVTLGDGTRSALYVAKAAASEQAGTAMPEIQIAADDPLLSWMSTGKTLLINVGRDVSYSVPLSGADDPVRAFTVACRR